MVDPDALMELIILGVIQVVDKVIQIPKTIGSFLCRIVLTLDWNLENSPNLLTFNSLYKKSPFPSSHSLFVPDNSSFEALHPVELSYLETHFGRHDRANLIGRHVCEDILYTQDLKKGGKVSSLEGEYIRYREDTGDILIDDANVTESDFVSRNGSHFNVSLLICIGVIHVISKLLVPSSVVFTPLKYIYGLHDFIFAETLAASDSFIFANDSTLQQTIFAPIDKAYADSFNTEEVLKQIRYNFIDDSIDLENLKHNDLLETKYTLKSLHGAGQMIKVTKVDNKTFLNNRAEVLGKPGISSCNYQLMYVVRSGNTLIYEVAGQLTPPGALRPTSSQGLSLFRSFHHLVSTGLDQQILFDEDAITVLLPEDHAWKTLGLAERFLLSEDSRDALRKVMLHGILKGVHYSKDFSSKSRTYTSLNGDKVSIHLDGKNLIFDDLNLRVAMGEHDILSSNGVAHSLSAVPIPSQVIITPENLINATGLSSWRDILKKYNLTRYLDLNENHTLLIPSDEAINKSPVSSLNDDAIKRLINFHIIPPINGNPPPDLLTDTPILQKTLAGNSIFVHRVYTDVWSIQVNNSTNSARILDHGKTTNGAQILLIDQVLFEPTDVKWSWAKPLAVVIFAVAMTVTVASGVSYGIRIWQRRREAKPLFHSADPAESEPFLNGGTA